MDKLVEIETLKTNLPDWLFQDGKIEKQFEFKDFKGSMDFVNKIAKEAEKMNHHPEIEINYNKVEIELTTHDESGVTEKDLELAGQIERIYHEN